MQKKADEAYGDVCAILDNNLNNIDFDDDDDVKELFHIILRALDYRDNKSEFHGEIGIKLLEYLISKGFDVNFKLLKKECLILFLAKEQITPELFSRVVALGADVYSHNYWGDNVLTVTCGADFDSTEALAIFIIENYDLSVLNHPDRTGFTPLMYAVKHNRPRLAEALINHGADVNEKGGESDCSPNGYGLSPFALACWDGNYDMAKMLSDAGADELACDLNGTPASFFLAYTPNGFSVKKGEIVSLLKNIEATDGNGNTLLLKALAFNKYPLDKEVDPRFNPEVIKALIARGANVNAAGNDGRRPIHYAAKCYGDIYKELLAAGADINAVDNDGNTALIIECLKSGEKKARMLLKKGADFSIRNNAGMTAADIAAAHGLEDVLELMITD